MTKFKSIIKKTTFKRVLVSTVVFMVLLVGAERVLDHLFPFPEHLFDRYGESRRIYDSQNRLLRLSITMDGERLIKIPLTEVSEHMINAIIAGEDGNFFGHSGVDPYAVIRACVTSAQRRKVISGASTITMQVARMVEPRPRTLKWKMVEMFRARQLERKFSKEQILEKYINLVPLGGTLRGVEAASQRWFGKSASDLTSLEAAMFVAMLPAPSRRSPNKTTNELLVWRNEILRRMCVKGYIDDTTYLRFCQEPLHAKFRQWDFLAPHYVDWKLKTQTGKSLSEQLELPRQKMVEELLQQRPNKPVDGEAVVVLSRHTGAVLAMAGSDNYREKPFNAALAHRTAGSTLKPFLYALALEEGVMGIEGKVSDHPGTFGEYCPTNFSDDFLGNVRASEALSSSRNLPAVRLLKSLGVEKFSHVLMSLGFDLPQTNLGLDLSLGTLSVSPLELAKAYQKFFDIKTNEMSWASREAILKALSQRSPDQEQLPVESIAWKTGTSSGRRDAWCVGVSQDHVVVVWLGNLDGRGDAELVGSHLAREVLVSVFAKMINS